MSLFSFLLICCLFFSGYDVVVEKIWWTSFSIYLPCGLLFGWGGYGWYQKNAASLRWLARFLMLINVFLLLYGSWLWGQGEALWGPLTLAFLLLIGPLTWMAWKAGLGTADR